MTSQDGALRALARDGLTVTRDGALVTIRATNDPNGLPAEVLLPHGHSLDSKAIKQLQGFAQVRHPAGGEIRQVFATPDFHPGSGVPVGCVVATSELVIPAAIGTDINCFTGDTKVPLLDGTVATLEDLSHKGTFWIWAINDKQKITAAEATAFKTGTRRPLLKITLDNNETIRCTPDHRFMLRDGSYSRADDLKPDASLMPFYSRTDKDGYVMIQQPYSGRWQRAHWAVARTGILGAVPKFDGQRTVIHHRNFQKHDNSPSNLEFMGASDHQRYHLSNTKHPAWQSPLFEERRKQALRAKADSPEGRKFYAERASKRFKEYHRTHKTEFRQAVASNGRHGASSLTVYNQSEKGRETSRRMASRQYTCPHCGKIGTGGFFFPNHINKCKPDNHRVVSVEAIDPGDTFCINVPGLENFALDAGVFVHNCGMRMHVADLTVDELLSKKSEWVTRLKGDLLMSTRDIPMDVPQIVAMFRAGPLGWLEEVKRRPLGMMGRADLRQLSGELERSFGLGSLDGDVDYAPIDMMPHDRDVVRDCFIGTIGSGNHFVELQVVEEIIDRTWAFRWGIRKNQIAVMAHSGSRRVGIIVGQSWMQAAKDRWPTGVAHPEIFSLQGEAAASYLSAMNTAANYAAVNRLLLVEMVRDRLRQSFGPIEMPLVFDAPHNIVTEEGGLYVHRKGATPAYFGDPVLIPGSMGQASYLLVGLGNDRFLRSASHGAGRKHSRRDMHRLDKQGIDLGLGAIECITLKNERLIQEAPAAYKDVGEVVSVQAEAGIAKPVARMRPLLTFKA